MDLSQIAMSQMTVGNQPKFDQARHDMAIRRTEGRKQKLRATWTRVNNAVRSTITKACSLRRPTFDPSNLSAAE